MFLIFFRNILCPQQMFPSLRAQGNVMSNNVSATMCPRLPPPLEMVHADVYNGVCSFISAAKFLSRLVQAPLLIEFRQCEDYSEQP